MKTDDILVYASCGSAIVVLISCCIIMVRSQGTARWPSLAMLLAGVVLMGISRWRSMDMGWDKDGFRMKFETIAQQVATLGQDVEKIATLAQTSKQEVAALGTQMRGALETAKKNDQLIAKVRQELTKVQAESKELSALKEPLAILCGQMETKKDSLFGNLTGEGPITIRGYGGAVPIINMPQPVINWDVLKPAKGTNAPAVPAANPK